MRVAMVSEHASPLATLGGEDAGGQNVHVAALASTMARRGAEVVVHTRRDDARLPRRVELSRGAAVDHVSAGPAEELPKDELLPLMDEFADDLARQWRRERPDVVHAHFWMSAKASLDAAEPLGIPVVVTFHALGTVKRRYQGDRDTSPDGRIEIERDVMARARRIVATCTDEVFELVRQGADGERVTVIPCGVDLGTFTPEGPADRRAPGLHRLLTVGRLVERKGVGNVISALAELGDTELVVAGGPAHEELRENLEARRLVRLAEEEGVAERVHLLGRVERPRLPALIRSSDLVACVPWYEPFGIVPLEAMACGVPVVASAVGGLIDTVVDGVTGAHVPPRDPHMFAETARRLLDDAGQRARLGRAGVGRARNRYDWDRIAASTLNVYEKVSRRRRPGRGRFTRREPAQLVPDARSHVDSLERALADCRAGIDRVEEWGERLAQRLLAGGRLLAVGNGGSAAQAQHLTAELVGRYRTERCPLSAICLHGDTSSFTAIANDYGLEEAFARQVSAHARPGDVLVALSTSGASANILAAVRAATEAGAETWALTGPSPNPLADACDEAFSPPAPSTATVQELHLVAIHVLCGAVDRECALAGGARSEELVR